MGNNNSNGTHESIITEDNFHLKKSKFVNILSLLEKNQDKLIDEINDHLKWLLSGKNMYNISVKFKEDLEVWINYIIEQSLDDHKLKIDLNLLFELACVNNYPTDILSLFIKRGCDISRGIIVSEENNNLEICEWLVEQLKDKQKKFSLNLKLGKTGFQIGNNLINKISGPISITILKPKKTHSSQPIMILFGDEHEKKTPCNPCSNEDGCYNIYDEKFLEILNSMSSKPEHIIDVYTETRITRWKLNLKDTDYRTDFYNTTKYCYNFKETSVYERCKYKNMRFHHSDPRARVKKDKKYLEPFLEHILGKKFLHKIKLNIEKIIDREKEKEININIEEITEITDDIEKKISYIFRNEITEIYLEEFVKEIFNKLFEQPRTSFIMKQTKNNLYNLEFWSRMYLNSLKKYIKSINTDLYLIENGADMESSLLTVLFSPLLDIYFLSRNFKISKNIIKPALVIGYFGDVHCENISELLTKYMNYENFYTERKDPEEQCIEFKNVYIELKISDDKLITKLTERTGDEELNITLRREEDGSKNKKKSNKKKSDKKKSDKKKSGKKKIRK